MGASPTQHKAVEHFFSSQDNQQQYKKKSAEGILFLQWIVIGGMLSRKFALT